MSRIFSALFMMSSEPRACSAVVMRSRFLVLDLSLEEAAQDLGAKPLKVFFVITLPIVLPAIISGWLLGFTISLPTEDKFLTTKQELMDTLSMTLGGRAEFERMQADTARTTYLLDVRDPAEFVAGHLIGSRSAPR